MNFDFCGGARLGDIEMEGWHWAEAAEHYRRAAAVALTDATLMYRMGYALAQVPAKAEQGRKMLAFVPALVLGDSQIAVQVAECMRKFEGKEVGDKWLDAYEARYTNPGQEYFQGFARRQDAAVACGDWRQAAALQELMLAEYGSHLQAMERMAEFHRLRALAALSEKDFAVLADALMREMDFAPPDVATLEKTLPALKAADAGAAGRVLEKAIGRLRPVVEDYPEAEKYGEALRRVEAFRG